MWLQGDMSEKVATSMGQCEESGMGLEAAGPEGDFVLAMDPYQLKVIWQGICAWVQPYTRTLYSFQTEKIPKQSGHDHVHVHVYTCTCKCSS